MIETPVLDLMSTAELQMLALHALLIKQGVSDPIRFLKENDVEYVTAFKPTIGMAITIIKIATKPETSPNERG